MVMDPETAEQSLGIKVEGDLGHLQITEGSSDSEDENSSDDHLQEYTQNTLANIPSDLVQPISPVVSSLAITSSENVQIGNNTYFNGPVTIKQIIQPSSGVDNAAYTKTEDENSIKKYHSKEEDSSMQKFKIQMWHKLTLSAIGVILVGGVCALIVAGQNTGGHDGQSATSDSISGGDPSNHTQVVGCGNFQVKIFITSMFIIPFTFLLLYRWSLPTKEVVGSAETNIGGGQKTVFNNIVSYDHYNACTKYSPADELLIAPGHLRIVPRTDWLAQPVDKDKPLDPIKHPIPWVIITHTATESCHIQSECVLRVRLIQSFHVESRGWYDIGYNFLVGGDGSAYYGRGWDYIGAHTKGYNKYSIAIAFIGTFNTENPPRQQVEACKKLIKQGVDEGKLAKDYKLFAHRQLMSSLSPGDKVFDIIKKWPHFVNNDTDIADIIPNY